MNYALDALWWRLTDPDVRALAGVLTAPALWRSGSEIPVRTLLGGRGFRYLLSLDGRPAPLHAHLAEEAPFGHRLGFYAESLLAFWLANAPHCRLLARNLPVREGGRTLGALDFVAYLDGWLYHLELACKYYGGPQALPETLSGLNRNDTLAAKAAKLDRQLSLARSAAGRDALAQIGADADETESVSVVRGMGFAAEGQPFDAPPLNPLGWHGRYLAHGDPLPFAAGALFYILPHMARIAPARAAAAQCCGKAEIAAASGVLFALMERRPDGMMHETARFMKAAKPV